MSLVRWELFQNIERLFDENVRPVWAGNFGWDLAADVDVYEKDNQCVSPGRARKSRKRRKSITTAGR